jgi:hypothetical protein
VDARYLLFVTQPYSFGILRPLQAAIRRRGGATAWFLHEVDTAGLHADETRLDTVPDVRRFAPRAVFVPGNWVPPFFPGLKVEVFHGLGVDKRGHYDVRGLFDLYCTPGPAVTARVAGLAARHGHFEAVETGWPKLDPLFGAASAARRAGPPRVLFAPTFSPSLTSAPALVATVRELVAARPWEWTVKFHPKERAETVAAYAALEGPRCRVSRDADIVPLLHDCDVLLTDTSSVSTEFLLLDKPVVTFRNANPGPHLLDVRDAAAVGGALERALARPPELLAAARAYGATLHPARDGRSSERVLDAVDAFLATGVAARLAPRPLNLWRRWQARRRLRWFLP